MLWLWWWVYTVCEVGGDMATVGVVVVEMKMVVGVYHL